MRIRVLFFGVLRDAVSQQEELLELEPPATAGTVLGHYRQAAPALGALWSAVAIAVNQQYVPVTMPLADGDEVALLPPVSGGAPGSSGAPSRSDLPSDFELVDSVQVALTRETIDPVALLAKIKAGPDGAVVLFDGIVRNNTRGRQTLYLVYEAYEAMALAQMQALAAKALGRFPVRSVALVHRLGRLAIGESSVLIVVASAHRGAAFDACRWLIDTLKKTVPVWKKEHFVDGAVWADGEPFPPEIVRTENQV